MVGKPLLFLGAAFFICHFGQKPHTPRVAKRLRCISGGYYVIQAMLQIQQKIIKNIYIKVCVKQTKLYICITITARVL